MRKLLRCRAFVEDLNDHMRTAGFEDIRRSFGYVFRLLAHDELTLRDLATALEMTSQGALKIVDEMATAGYVERLPDAVDGRVKRLRLTGRGRSALRVARRFHRDYERRLAKQIGAEEASAVRATLVHLTELPGAGGGAQSRRANLRPM